jgi:hypothetical protein
MQKRQFLAGTPFSALFLVDRRGFDSFRPWGGKHPIESGRAGVQHLMLMSQYQREVEFLRQCILHNESEKAGRQELEEEITHIQRNRRCVQRAAWLMVVLTTLAVAGLGYPGVLLENYPDTPLFLVNLLCALGVGSLISLLVCAGLEIVYRKKLDQRKEACRQMVAKLLAEARAMREKV